MAAPQNPKPDPTRHVAVLAFPFGTHAGPLLSLVRSLSAAAPDVKFSFLSTSRSNKTLFAAAGTRGEENVRPYDIDDGARDGYAPLGNPIEAVEIFLEATPGNFERGLEAAEKEVGLKIGCLVSDAFYWFGGELADERRIPWVPLWTAAARSLLVHVDTDEIRRNLDNQGISSDQTLDFLPGFSSIRGSDLPEGVIIPPNKPELPFDILLHKMGLTLPNATAVVINTFHQIDPEISAHLKTRFKNTLNIGPFTLTTPPNPKPKTEPDSNGCLEWLSGQETASVVYISFGSLVTPPSSEIAAIVEALEESGVPYLWSYRGKLEEILGGKSESTLNGKLVPWAPQVEVLRHPSVGAFVTHCGWNSILESVVGGVPLIGRPFFGDQRLNMRALEAVWGIGVGVGGGGVITKRGVLEALRRVLVEDEGKGMRERIGVLKKLAYEAVGVDGSSRKDFNDLVEIVTNGN